MWPQSPLTCRGRRVAGECLPQPGLVEPSEWRRPSRERAATRLLPAGLGRPGAACCLPPLVIPHGSRSAIHPGALKYVSVVLTRSWPSSPLTVRRLPHPRPASNRARGSRRTPAIRAGRLRLRQRRRGAHQRVQASVGRTPTGAYHRTSTAVPLHVASVQEPQVSNLGSGVARARVCPRLARPAILGRRRRTSCVRGSRPAALGSSASRHRPSPRRSRSSSPMPGRVSAGKRTYVFGV